MEPEQEKPQSKDDELLSWEIPSHEHRPKTFNFYTVVLAAMVILLLFSVWQKNFLFGMFIIMATGTILFLSLQRPEMHTFTLTRSRIIFGNYEKSHAYTDFSCYDIQEFSDTDIEIFFAFKNKDKTPIHLRIYRRDQAKIVAILEEHGLKEKDVDISFFDSLSKIIGI